jgi:hypothetical protein
MPQLPSGDPIPEARVHAALKRAAQLQAEATERLEQKARVQMEGREGASAGGGFFAEEVEAAAVEAGIAPEYIRQALVEQDALGEYAEDLPRWMDRLSDRMLRTRERSIELSRVIPADPAVVLEAMQRIFPAHPYGMTLVDSVGGHPLQGGVLVFELPRISFTTTSGSYTPFSYAATAIDLLQIHVSLRALPGESGGACEVTLRGDLRTGLRRNGWMGVGLTGLGGAVGAFFTALAVVATGPALPLGVAAISLGAGGVGGLSAAGYGAAYRYYLRKMIAQLEVLLKVLDTNVRTGGAFRLPEPPASGTARYLPRQG